MIYYSKIQVSNKIFWTTFICEDPQLPEKHKDIFTFFTFAIDRDIDIYCHKCGKENTSGYKDVRCNNNKIGRLVDYYFCNNPACVDYSPFLDISKLICIASYIE